jgi:hypothetical protein
MSSGPFRSRVRPWYLVIPLLTGLAAPAIASRSHAGSDSGGAGYPVIKVLSNRADLISGGDALVEVVPPAGLRLHDLTVRLNGRDVTRRFGVRATDHRFVGLVTGLHLGRNPLVATARPTNNSARIVITNHRSGGPIIAGEQVRPWFCQTQEAGFGKPRNARCDVTPHYDFFYESTDPAKSGLQPYDPKSPPSDVATTTTDQGEKVPFIVRRETGVVDRGWYVWALLYNPKQPWTPQDPQRGWNHKFVYTFGGSCGVSHFQGSPPDVFSSTPLGSGTPEIPVAGWNPVDQLASGFAVGTGSLQVLGNDCDVAVSAEGLMMQEERIREQYGEIRYTIGTGCSGGSMQQFEIAEEFPGLLNGLIPSCTFPDASRTSTGQWDNVLLERYFEQTSPYLWADEQQQAEVYGQASSTGYTAAAVAIGGLIDPTTGCGTSGHKSWMYDPKTNPHGARCTLQDFNVGRWGRRTDGKARIPWADDGRQYGLVPLQSGEITPLQFADMNAKVGSLNIDGVWQSRRATGAEHGNLPVFKTMHRVGGMNDMRQVAQVPIIDVRGTVTNNYEFHMDQYDYTIMERLKRSNGTDANFVLFKHDGGTFYVPKDISALAFKLMDQWLTTIEQDRRHLSLPSKVIRDKPAQAVNSCWVGTQRVTDQEICRLYPYYSQLEIAAGQDDRWEIVKCQLKPLRKADYAAFGISFTDSEWAQLERAFPHGVCDYTKPGAGQVPSRPWMSFGSRAGVGRPLGAPPHSVGIRD